MSTTQLLMILCPALLAWLPVAAAVHAVRLRLGDERRRMFAASYRSVCDGIDGAGISVISLGPSDPATVARLLASEYERCEVIVVTDSARDGGAFLERLTGMFSLVTVDYRPPEEFLDRSSVRRLCRSRRRRFRRLTVVDTVSESRATDADTAVGIALYDYVAVLDGDTVLLRGAVERLAAEICSSPRPPREISPAVGARFRLCLRDDVVAQGGFSSGLRHFCPRDARRRIAEPLAAGCSDGRCGRRAFAAILLSTAAVCTVLAIVTVSPLPLAAFALTWLSVAAAMLFSASFSAPDLGGRRAFGCAMRNFCENLH